MNRLAVLLEKARTPMTGLAGVTALIGVFFVVRRVGLSLGASKVVHEPLEGAAYLSMVAWRDGGWSAMYPTSYAAPGEPLVVTPYPPLFHAMWRWTSVLLGDGASYTPGRIVANGALLAIVILIYACARRGGASRLLSALFSVIFLLPVPVALWAGVARVDVPGIAFALAGLWLYLKYREDEQSYAYLTSAVPIVLAGFTKQSLVAVPAAIVLSELLARRFRRAALFAAATAGPVLGGFVLLNWMTDGGFFDATVTSLADEFFFAAGLSVVVDFFVTNPLMLTLVLLTLSLMRFAERGDAVLVWFVATSCGVLALTIGKPGANVNYFVEPIAALCMCGAVGLQRWQARRGWGAFVTTAVAFVVMWSVADLVPGYRAAYRSQAATIARSEAIALPPEALGGPVLVPASLTLLVEPRPEYYVNDSYTVGVVAAWGKLMTTDRIVDDLRHQRVGAVLVRPEEFRRREDGPNFIGDWQRGWNFWSIDEFREALLDAYAPVDRQYPLDVVLLLPKDSAGASARVPEPISLGLRGGWMDDDYGRSYRDLYRRHWWWRAREDLIVDILLHRLPAAARRRVLDVGCGDGVFFDRLEALGAEVRGIEPDESLVSKDGKHRSKIHVGAFDDAFETREPFSLVTMLDVLEHMADPSAALRRAREVVEPHGWWLFTVPAFPMLWTQHDVLNHHYARFTKRTLRALLRSAGLDAMRLEYFFHWLVPLKLAVRLKERVRAAAPAAPRVPATVINRTCYWISRGERATVGRPGVLPGSSLLAYGRFPA